MSQSNYFDYSGERSRTAIFPIGGIGAGAIGIATDGRLAHWEINQRPDKGSVNGLSHFAIRAERDGKLLDARLLHGPYARSLEGERGAGDFRQFGFGARRELLTGLPHFAQSEFHAFFPCASHTLHDKNFPGTVTMDAFSAFVPGDVLNSSLPAAPFEWTIHNTEDFAIDYSIVAVLGDYWEFDSKALRASGEHWKGLSFGGIGHDDRPSVLVATDAARTSIQTTLYRGSWYDSLQVYWNELSTPGMFRDRDASASSTVKRRDGKSVMRLHALLAAHVRIPAGEHRRVRFAFAWHVPKMQRYWKTPYSLAEKGAIEENASWRPWHATQWKNVDAITDHLFDQWDRLETETRRFAETMQHASLPVAVRDAVSANLSSLVSPSVNLLEDGTFYAFEGSDATEGSCEGNCNHVWNYAQALPWLFPTLERTIRDADYKYNIDQANGAMAFRLALPLGVGRYDMRPAVDGQMGNVLKVYRDWKLCGDTAWLGMMWPGVKQSLEYAWHPDNPHRWDPDRTGLLRGRQHTTLDMALFGPNAWLSGYYIAALLAAEAMARAVGDVESGQEYRRIADKGRSALSRELFNGEYYVQRVAMNDKETLSPYPAEGDSPMWNGTVEELYWNAEAGELKYQVGDGCLVDQLVSQWHADLYGLPLVFERSELQSTLDAIWRNNVKTALRHVANPCRVFGTADEGGAIICDWPVGTQRPAIPAPYSQEVWAGMEYAYAALLMSHGRIERGCALVKAVRDRYRGHNRNPWSEMECGSHYARSMSSYSLLLVLSGFQADMTQGRVAFAPKVRAADRFRSIWSLGYAWGEVRFTRGLFELQVLGGVLNIKRLHLPFNANASKISIADASIAHKVDEVNGDHVFAETAITAEQTLIVANPEISVEALPDVAALETFSLADLEDSP